MALVFPFAHALATLTHPRNCFGLSVAIGLTNALDTLVSQAHGAGENELCDLAETQGKHPKWSCCIFVGYLEDKTQLRWWLTLGSQSGKDGSVRNGQ